MNSRLYRVIFNKNLGRLVVVSEKTVAQGKAGSQGGSDNAQTIADSQTTDGVVGYCYGKWLSLSAAVLLSLGSVQMVHAEVQTQVIADTTAAKNEQAIILTTASGMTQVNIQTPSVAGVSKNSFSQFDVGSDGVILNNSRTNTQTQMAGWVEGNTWLAKGEAKVILNQVNSTNPSQLAGYTEIAGGKAELIIANPAGITCSGCGFINASRTTLTTGKPQINDGKLTGFDVDGGKIRIDGTGMDSSNSDYTQLISQTNEINAKVYAKNLDVISGSNQVSYDTDATNTKITQKATTNQPTGVALDVSSLGGMYAGKIRLIGTDKGMGVTNAGDISATSGLSLDSQGNLTNTGYMGAKDGATINVNGNRITNSGTIASSQKGIQLDSSSLDNSGLITAREQGAITNTTINNTGTISAGQVSLNMDNLNNQGRIEQTGTGKLDISTDSLTNQQQAVIGQALYADQPAATNPSLANTPSTAATGSQKVTDSTTDTSDATVPVLELVTANGQISAKRIDNQGSNAIITANGGIDVTTQTLANTDKSSIAVNGLQAAIGTNNQNGRLQLDNLNWQLASFNNNQGQIVSKQGIHLTSESPINNNQGILATLGDASIHSDGELTNTEGLIQGKNTDISAASLDNRQGSIDAKGHLTLNSQGDLINTQGTISAQGDVSIQAVGLNNNQGNITATGQLTTQSQNLTNSGQIYGGTGNTLTSGTIDNSGVIASGGANIITGSSLNNTDTGVLAAGLNPDGSLASQKADLTVTTTGSLTSRGTHIATGLANLTGNPTDLSGSTTQAGTITMASDADLSTQGAKLTATDTMSLTAKGTLNNQYGQLAANTLNLTANRLDNQDGVITQAGNQDLTLAMQGGINNQDGVIATNSQNLTINTAELNNQAGSIQHAGSGTLSLTTNSVNNSQQGQVLSLGEQTWHVASDIDNQSGVIQGSRFDISANSLQNQGGVVAAISQIPTTDSKINLTETLDNQQGTIANTASGLNLTAGSIDNTSGQVVSTGGQTWQLAGDVNNQGGQIQGSQFRINAQNLNNQDGVIVASSPSSADSAVNLTGNLTNSGNAAIYAGNGSLTLQANHIDNAAQITSRDNLTSNSQSFTNGGNIYAGGNASITNQGQLTNTATIAAGNHVNIDTGSLNQTADGQLIAGLSTEGTLSQNTANLTVTSRDVQTNAGLNLATGYLSVTGSGLDYTGSQNQAQNLAFTAKAGDVNLSGAQSQAAGQIAVTTPASFMHDNGVMQADHYALNTGNASNQNGTIIQTGSTDLTVNTGNFNNQGGQFGGNANNLNIVATGDINNQDGAIIHTGNGNVGASAANVNNTRGQVVTNGGLNLTSSGTITNDAGVMQAAQAAITAGQLNNQTLNSQGGLILTTSGDLTLTGNVNSQGDQSVIQAAGNLTANVGSLNNVNGAMLSANKTLTLTADSLTNDNALVVANEAVSINAGRTNNSGTIASVNDGINVSGNSLINADIGNIQAVKAITITEGTISNQGQIATGDALTVNSTGLVDNQGGVLVGSHVNLAAQSLNNDAGLISQSAADGNLTITTQGLLDNKKTKSTTTPTGILANGTVTINAGDVNNQAGRINANALTLFSTGSSVNNNQGEIAANQGLTLNAGNATLTNQTGQLLGNTTNLTAAVLDNSNQGLVLANQDLTVNASSIDNSNSKRDPAAQLSQGIVAGGNTTLTTNALNNSNGQVVAGNAANLAVNQTLNNQSGRIESNHVKVGGNASVNNSDGVMTGYQQLDMTARGLTNTKGQLRAPLLNVNLTDSYTHANGDKLEADMLNFTTQGNFTNQGQIATAERLAITAQNIDNQKDASLVSGDVTELNVSQNISNRGLINGSKTYLTAGNTLNNLSYGRIYGDHVAIKADTLNNTPEGNGTPAPVIAARGQLDIGVKHLNNNPNPDRAGIFNSDFNGQAQIVSNSNLNIGGDLDANHVAIGKADSVVNKGATIESIGDMNISSLTTINENADYKIDKRETNRENITRYQPNGQSTWYDSSDVSFDTWGYEDRFEDKLVYPGGDSIKYYKDQYSQVTQKDFVTSSDPSRIISGGNLILEGNTYLNQDSFTIQGNTLVTDYKNQTLGEFINKATKGTEIVSRENSQLEFYTTKKGWYDWKRRDKRTIKSRTPIPNGEISNTTISLPILNADLKNVYTTLPLTQASTVDSLNKAVSALNTLKQTTQTATNSTGTTDNVAADKKNAIDLLSNFAKANPDSLTPEQQKQLNDILAAQQDGKAVSQAQLNGLIDSLNSSIESQYTEEVRATSNAITLPNSSLYSVDPNNPNGYLVETDPAFANYKKWLSSEYIMQRLGLDPSNLNKRLGDGYYEQGLIRDQVMALTGRRFLGDYTSDDDMYQSLMDNGVAAAKAFNLRPGIALTPEQMAQLTTDIVWLVEQTITLKDGSKQTVLVPKVYVRANVGDIKGDGSLIAARNVDMQLTGDLSNQGNIVVHNGLRIKANNLNNQNGGVIQGSFVQVNTKNDLNNLGATLKANSAMALDVGGNLNNTTTTYHTQSQAGQSNAWRTGIDQIGKIYVGDGLQGMTDENGRPLTTLGIDVGGNATFNAGQLVNHGGTTRLVAQGDVAFNAVNTGYQTNAIGDGNNYYKAGQTQGVGSVLVTSGDTFIKGNKVTGTATTIQSGNNTIINADNNIAFKEGRATQNLSTANRTTDKGFLSKKTTQDRYDMTSDQAIGSHIDGDKVSINAKNDVHLTATDVISDHGTYIKAGNNLTIDTAENRYSEISSHDEKKFGVFGTGSGLGFTIGSQKTQNQNSTEQTWHTGSNIGTNDGNTVLTAGNHYQQTGSVVSAGNESNDNVHDLTHGTVVINAKSATIQNTTATTETHSRQNQKTSGLTVSVSNSLVDQVQGINSLVKAGETTNSDQMKVMAGVASVAKARTLRNNIESSNQAYHDPNKYAPDGTQLDGKKDTADKLGSIGNTRIQATIGSLSSSSTQDSLSGKNEASQINANNAIFNIQGAGKDSDLTFTGSDLNLKGDRYNNVEGDVIEQAATGTGYDRSSNKSSGFGVGVYADTKGSAGITANANMAKGHGNGETTTNTNSHINVAGTTYQNVGGDYILDGAVEKGGYMTGHIGGGIKATSRQDTANYEGKQTNAGFSVDIDLAKQGTGSSFSVNGGRTKADADYAAVIEQTGLQYQKSDVVVDGKSTFKGAYFTTATPEDNKTQFNGGLEVSDIQNHSEYKASGYSGGISLSGNPTSTVKDVLGSTKSTGIGYGRDGDSDTSTTYGAVTGRAGKSDVTTANVGSLNEVLQNNFDKDRVNAEIDSQVQVSQAFDTERQAYRGEMAKKEQDLRDAAKEAEKQGDKKKADELNAKADKQQHDMVILDGITGAIFGPNTNGVTGYVAKAIAPEISYQIGQYFKGNDYVNGKLDTNLPGEGSAPHILAHGILAAAVSYATGNNVTTGALSAMEAEAGAKYVAQYLYGVDKPSDLTAEQKQTVSNITSLVGIGLGATTGDVGSAVSASEVGKVGVENNGFNRRTREPERILLWKQENRQVVDDILKNTTIEGSAAAWYGLSFGATYVGDGKINTNIAFINGGWALEANASKSLNLTPQGRSDGVYMETCASGGSGASVGVCVGSNGSNNPVYSYGKVGTGAGFKYGNAIGYSETFQIPRLGSKEKSQ